MEQELLTVAQFAERANCSTKTVRRAIKQNALRTVKVGTLVRIPASELQPKS